jgi:uncharacterized damage-inducible protein DinB
MSFQQELAALFHRDLRRLVQELEAFPGDAYLWQTAPGISNPAGNITLHLEGNLREFIGRVLGGVDYQRDRPYEFAAKNMPASGLIARIQAVDELIPTIIVNLTDAQLDAEYTAYSYLLSTRQFLMHLIAHFNFHLGQIGYLRRFLTQGSAVKFVELGQ